MSKVVKQFHRALAGFMLFWLSGIVLLFCCQMSAAQFSGAQECPLSRMSGAHCSKVKKSDTSLAFSGFDEASEVNCCAFLPGIFDKTRKIQEFNFSEPAGIAVYRNTSYSFSDKFHFTDPKFEYRSRIFSGNKLFVTNCVFRI